MWWCRTMPPSEPSPARRARRLARPGAASIVSLSIPSRASTSARNRVPAISFRAGSWCRSSDSGAADRPSRRREPPSPSSALRLRVHRADVAQLPARHVTVEVEQLHRALDGGVVARLPELLHTRLHVANALERLLTGHACPLPASCQRCPAGRWSKKRLAFRS